MTPEEVYRCVRFLSDCYGVPEPTVIITDDFPRRYAGLYDPDTQTIFLRPRALNEITVVHEVGHHLQNILGLPNERGAEEFEEAADCEVCRRVFPTPDMRSGSEVACPWCGSVYKRVQRSSTPQFPVDRILGLIGVLFGGISLAQSYVYYKRV